MIEEVLPPERQPLASMMELYERDVRNCPPGHHLDLPIKIAYGICGKLAKYWPYLMDFIQEGNVELLRCIDVFNKEYPDEDNEHFRNYAAACIRGAIYHYFSRIPDIYIPGRSRVIYFVEKERYEELDILEHCVSFEALHESMLEIEEPTTMQIALYDAKWQQVHTLLEKLPPRERQAMIMRYGIDGPAYDYEEIAAHLHIVPKHARMIEKIAIGRMNGTNNKQTRAQGLQQREKERRERLQSAYDPALSIHQLAHLAHCHCSVAAQFLREQKEK